MNLKVKNALISVSNKENLVSLLKSLKKFKINIISSGGTYASIKKMGYKCKELSKYTGFKEKDGYPIRYAFRFHINPELSVIKTMSGNSALIQISKNKSLIFSIDGENLDIEKSVFLSEKKIIDSTCITISGNLVNKNKIFNWELKKNI